MHLVNDPINPCLRVFYDWCSERFVVNSCRVALWPLLFFVLFVMTVVVPLAAFLRFKEGLFSTLLILAQMAPHMIQHKSLRP